MMASYAPPRALHDQGIAAYQRGQYQLAVRKLTEAYDSRPSPELVYHLAQAYRREGQWSTAVDLYAKYLEIAPNGPAAADCRAELERLRD
jgi:Flp pilus assembly protein TadD